MPHPRVFGLIVVVVGFMASQAVADPRTDYLISLLQGNGSYRVKVQAAATLGRIRASDAVPALVNALRDRHPAVVAAAAAALEQLEARQALPALRKALRRAKSKAVKSQVRSAIAALEKGGGSAQPPPAEENAVHLLVRVDAMGNSAGHPDPRIGDQLAEVVRAVCRGWKGVRLQPATMSDEAVRREVARGRKALIVSGALVAWEHSQGMVTVGIALNVFSNPDYALLMMPTGQIRVPVSGSLEEATREAFRRLVTQLWSKIVAAAPQVL